MRHSSLKDWNEYYRDIGISRKFSKEYLEYIKLIKGKRIPPIFEANHLCLLLGRDEQNLHSMIYATDKFYRSFNIRKRSGGVRQIVSPYPSLLDCQKWILSNILNKLRISQFATGFRVGSSILKNANHHCGNRKVIKLDIKDFFPSISFRRVMSVFTRLGYTQDVSFMLSRLCTLDGFLPQGAATSPALSNIICYSMDRRIYGLCKLDKLKYTRYADDITISGNEIRIGFVSYVEKVFKDNDFELNKKKTRILDENDRKVITGLDITNGIPRVSRDFRRDLQRDIFFVWSEGLVSHITQRKIFNPNYLQHLEGRLQFWKHVEPDNRQMIRCEKRLLQVLKSIPYPNT